MEIMYTPPESSVAFLGPDDDDDGPPPSDDEPSAEEPLLRDVRLNIERLEQGLLHPVQLTAEGGAIPKQPSSKRTSALRSVRNMMRLGKRRPSAGSSTDEEGSSLSPRRAVVPPPPTPRPLSPDDQRSPLGDVTELLPIRKPIPNMHTMSQSHLRAQDYQICVTILEARQLAGLNMDPVVCIQIGDEKKYTSVKESTNCPYYNEYFVFDFHMPPVMLFDKIITLSVLQARNMLRPNKMLGTFKLDVATVWGQPDHQFFRKWAMLTDPQDSGSGPKGYLKCDISVIGKGDTIKIPPKSEKDEDDIEANLLLPDGVPNERQRARFIVRIHSADGLPKMNLSIMANVKKAFTGEARDLVDPYVQVCFAGLTGNTSVKRNSYSPVWNEQIVFSDMFPPLCQRLRIQLRDHDSVKPTVIGTHYIDLKTISNDGERGFLPTFGPAYVYLYGSPRDYSLIDQHSALNSGLGEGVSYRAKVLISIRTEITDIPDCIPSGVDVEVCEPPADSCLAPSEEFLLFGAILDATMIDKKLTEKPISFELSIGNAGNNLDGHNQPFRSTEGHNKPSPNADHNISLTPPLKALSYDRLHYYMPYFDTKPCMFIFSSWPDHRRRLFTSNMIEKLADSFEEGLSISNDANVEDAPQKLRDALNKLHLGCARFLELRRPGSGHTTELDKKRNELLLREIEYLRNKSRHVKAIVTKSSFKERYKTALTFLEKLKFLIEDPQGALPDVVIWAVSGGRRLAYQRVPARDLLYSPVEEECGKLCGKTHTMFLKLPGKKADGASGWAIPTKLRINLWIGVTREKSHIVDGLPSGFKKCRAVSASDRGDICPPHSLLYTEQHNFQLRAYIYQARSLIGSDASGLSDPFARVIAGEYCRTTRVIDETLSPTWDQTLVCDDITMYGSIEQIKEDPQAIIIEIFDQDQVGKSEFIGRAMAKPTVKAIDDAYEKPRFPPNLQWYEITRGLDNAGELLAAFELIETTRGPCGEPVVPETVPDLLEPPEGQLLAIPDLIRPTLANYRIEILFWGLRDLKRVHFMTVDRPRVDIECAGNILYSSVIQNAQKNPNFVSSVKYLDVELPEQELYRPPLSIRVVDCRSFGRYTLVGTNMINSIQEYMYIPMTARERELEERKRFVMKTHDDFNRTDGIFGDIRLHIENERENCPLLLRETTVNHGYGTAFGIRKIKITDMDKKRTVLEIEDEECIPLVSKDWWTKYFASIDTWIEETKEAMYSTPRKRKKTESFSFYSDVESNAGNLKENLDQSLVVNDEKKRKVAKAEASTSKAVATLSPSPKHDPKRNLPYTSLFQIFPNELEAQPQFEEFKEWLQTFELYRGKKTGEDTEDENRVVGTFKGAIKAYKWPLPKVDERALGIDSQIGFFQNVPSNEPLRVLVRVYIVKANDLHPMDLNGKADPYIVLKLGSKTISDKENYISKQLNPVFGKCFEVEATFPHDSVLTVKIQDWDLVGSDDVIGETKIDLENRFYSRHRATCGLPRSYEEQGLSRWRDAMKPTQILAKLCKDGRIEPPTYEYGRVKIAKQIFDVPEEVMDCGQIVEIATQPKLIEEKMALHVLHRWSEVHRIGCELVPEHIETRPLYNPDKPGIERGKLEMWIDMFPMDLPPPGPPIDISPRKPRSYELRVIIWNTDDVVLEDDAFFTGEKMSDIYVKGWLKGPEDCQSTDIHYRSLTGEGNFNWRFTYPFEYLEAEEKIVISRKESMFSWDETESKIPARLECQVWDADHFSADDFLGAITFDLNRFPRGAKSSKLCTLDMLKNDGSVPMVNIFKQRRVKGWWPFYVKKENDVMELTGKVEAEFHLLTKEEAEKNPAGQGRNEPDALDRPNRPDGSFMWFLNPLKSVRYIVWHNYKWRVLKALIIVATIVMMLLFLYAFPGYTVKRFLGA